MLAKSMIKRIMRGYLAAIILTVLFSIIPSVVHAQDGKLLSYTISVNGVNRTYSYFVSTKCNVIFSKIGAEILMVY